MYYTNILREEASLPISLVQSELSISEILQGTGSASLFAHRPIRLRIVRRTHHQLCISFAEQFLLEGACKYSVSIRDEYTW